MISRPHDPLPPPPRPTIAPAIVGLGIAMFFAGAVLHWLVAVAGVVLLGIGIADWMLEVRNEWSEDQA